MKKTILAVLLMGLASYANADYSTAVQVSGLCQNIGGVGQTSYKGKQAGRARVIFPADESSNASAVIQFAIDYGYNKATSEKDAYMTAWAKCMDVLE